jgi:endonuclease/exonuclease/phosphatase family metal-dependent hydrolase
LGHVYSPRELTAAEREAVAHRLVTAAGIPLVLAAAGPATVKAWSVGGEFLLPRDAADILGAEHPYLDSVAADLVSLCHHPNAGDFVISGWRRQGEKISFPHENGAHGGPGSEETQAFVLVPGHTNLAASSAAPMRALDLRRAALQFLGRAGSRPRPRVRKKPADQRTVRLMTYNVHSCIGMDGRLLPERIARVIAQCAPDIVALQELDLGRARTGGVDQAKEIADDLQMLFHFHPAIELQEEQYGDAILSRYPLHLRRAAQLPALKGRPGLEPRGALWVAIEVGDHVVHVVNTHLGLHPRERRLQAEALCGPQWLTHPQCTGTRILCGDLNALPRSPVCRRLGGLLRDCEVGSPERPRRTFFSRYPLGRIDHVFVEADVRVRSVEVPSTALTRVASDHLPLIVELELPASKAS